LSKRILAFLQLIVFGKVTLVQKEASALSIEDEKVTSSSSSW
jgi:hypothetical protein